MIYFSCPSCQSPLRIPDEHAGKAGECFVCHNVFQAPWTSTTTPEGKPLENIQTPQSPQSMPPHMLPFIAVPSPAVTQMADSFNKLLQVVMTINRQMGLQFSAILKQQEEQEARLSDLTARILASTPHAARAPVRLKTEFPLAAKSVDHLHPRGVKDSYFRWPRFVAACERHFQRPLKFVDLGCAGGGVVLDFLVRGHCGVGLEGSDYALRNLRAEWRTIPRNLFTCDISRPFELLDAQTGEPFKADVISMWEVLEHIPSDRLPVLFKNIRDHLADDGLFVGSVATFADHHEGVQYHATLEPRAWWEEALRENGLVVTTEPIFDRFDYCRGIGRDAVDSSYYDETFDTTGIAQRRPGFHVVARRGALGPAAGTVPPAQGVPDYSP